MFIYYGKQVLNMPYEIYATETFLDDYNRLANAEKERINKIKEQLKINPYVGKPLGYRFFREKKLNGNRIYYIIFEDVIVVLLVAYSDKKTQQATIDTIKKAYDIYRKEISDKFKKD